MCQLLLSWRLGDFERLARINLGVARKAVQFPDGNDDIADVFPIVAVFGGQRPDGIAAADADGFVWAFADAGTRADARAERSDEHEKKKNQADFNHKFAADFSRFSGC